MISGLNAASDRFLAALARITARADRAQRQIGSGKKLEAASDQPSEVSRLLIARGQLEQTLQLKTNLGRAKAEVDTAERALQTAVKVLERVVTIGAQGATATQTPTQRTIIAVEVQAALEQMVNIAGTTVEGRHVFSGDDYRNAPYTLDLTQPNGVSAYAGSAATREIMHPSGTRFTISRSADQIFDSPGASVFAAINNLRIALQAVPTVAPGDPDYNTQYEAQTAAISAALLDVKKAQDHLSAELSHYGTIQNRIEEALETANKLKLRQETELSEIEDADVIEAIIQLNEAQIHKEVALASHARTAGRSLFDYLG
ncbi:MAG: flagellin [Rhodospirillales bacterium]